MARTGSEQQAVLAGEAASCYRQFCEALRESDEGRAQDVMQAALGGGVGPGLLLNGVLAPALEELGEGWQDHEVSLSQIYAAGRIAERTTDLLLPLFNGGAPAYGKVVVGNALGDHHGLGRRVVAAFLRSAGFQVIDLGLSVAPELFVATALAEGARVIAVSALMANTALHVRAIRAALRDRDADNIKLLVGGAPFRYNPALHRQVGADATATNAAAAIGVVSRLLGEG